MQTILGAGGVIATELAKALPHYQTPIRLVSRSPQKVNDQDELVNADLTDLAQTRRAVEGSQVVYLTVGLPYKTNVWTELWPKVMQNTLTACAEVGAKLVFFDNVYPLGKQTTHMTEETPLQPASKKGEVRARIVNMLEEAVEKGSLEAQIARSADFYGPGATNSPVNMMLLAKAKAHQKASWLGKDSLPHSLTYTPDAGKATALLGNTPSAFNQRWHLPTAQPPMTGKEYVNLASVLVGDEIKCNTITSTMMRMAGWFDPMARSTVEMMYQFTQAYFFDSSKFTQAFGGEATPYADGFEETLASM